MKKNVVVAIIVAAGVGQRLNSKIPKQYHKIRENEVIRLSVMKFLFHPGIDKVLVVINKHHTLLAKKALDGLKILPLVYGGETRQDSVLKGLKAIKSIKPKKVLVHDAARPNVSDKTITLVLKNIKSRTAVVPAISINDSIISTKMNSIALYNDKNLYKLIQTPQGFVFNNLYEIHLSNKKFAVGDDSQLFNQYPNKIKLVNGDPANIKITKKEDLKNISKIMNEYIEVSALGFDVHKFSSNPSKNIKLGGININFSKKLEGHSDADVVLHALVDSMLGTISKGDIGTIFSNKDKKWKNADSKIFVKYALSILNDLKCIIRHVDITIICEEPKITPHASKMKRTISKLLNISNNSVSIKSTTSEGLGFTGRKEGIAAKCLTTVSRPQEHEQ